MGPPVSVSLACKIKRCIPLMLSRLYDASDDFDAVARAIPPKANDHHAVMAIRER
jgi:hypothetical protein